jgi:hypothetical protein
MKYSITAQESDQVSPEIILQPELMPPPITKLFLLGE